MVPVPYFLVLVSEDGMPDVKPLFNVLLYSDFLLVDMDRPDERGDHEVWIFNWKTGILLVVSWSSFEPSPERMLIRNSEPAWLYRPLRSAAWCCLPRQRTHLSSHCKSVDLQRPRTQ